MSRTISVVFGLMILLVHAGWTQATPSLTKTPNAEDPFVGTWKMNPEKSELDPKHRAMAAKMYWEREADGYRMSVEGINARGQVVKEAPQRFLPDAKEHPASGAPGVTMIVTRPEPNTMRIESKKDGQVVGQATYAVSRDRKSLTATVSGIDGKRQAFQTRMVFDRE